MRPALRAARRASRLIAAALLIAAAASAGASAPGGKQAAGQSPAVLNSWHGDEQAIAAAKRMFDAIGGRQRWADLRGLYIRALHTQPDLDKPYVNEIWRAMDSQRLRIRQTSEDWNAELVMDGRRAWLRGRDGQTRELPRARVKREMENHNRNIYCMLHRLAMGGGIVLRAGRDGRLELHERNALLAAFQLDALGRPARYIVPGENGETASVFTRWASSEGLVHPTEGGPEDGSFHFDTRTWTPAFSDVAQAFGVTFTAP